MFKFHQDIPFCLDHQSFSVISSIAFSDDCTFLAIALLREIKVYNLIEKQIAFTFFSPNLGQSLIFSQNNQYLACVGDGYQVIIIWSLKKEQNEWCYQILDSAFNQRSITFNKDCKEFVYLNKQSQIIRWDMIKNELISQYQLDPMINYILSGKINSNIQIVTLLSNNRQLIFYDYISKTRLLTHKLKRNQVNNLIISKDGQFLFLNGDMELIQQYDIRQIKSKKIIKLIRQHKWINNLFYFYPQLSQDRSIILALKSNDIEFLIWDLKTGQQIKETLQPDKITVYHLSLNLQIYLLIQSQNIIKVFTKFNK